MHTIYSRLRLQVLFPAPPKDPDIDTMSGFFLFAIYASFCSVVAIKPLILYSVCGKRK